MKRFSAEIEISGSAEAVWAVVTDLAAYPDWEPSMDRLEGAAGLDEKLVLHTKLSKRPFKVTVSELTTNVRMTWSSGMPMGLFKGVRTFEIASQGDTVRFSLEEVFSGVLSPLIGMMIPDLNPSFQGYVQALKDRVEGTAAPEAE